MPPKKEAVGNSDVSQDLSEFIIENRPYDDKNIKDAKDNIDSGTNFPTPKMVKAVVFLRCSADWTGCSAYSDMADFIDVCMKSYEDGTAKKAVIGLTKDPNANNRLVGLVAAPNPGNEKGQQS